MGPGVNTWFLILVAFGWASGFKTKMCEHQETVEAIKKTYSCALEFGKDLLKKDLDLANTGQLLEEATQKCLSVVLACIPLDDMALLQSDPSSVVATDNNCKVEQIMGVQQKILTCASGYGIELLEDKVPTFTHELCDKIGAAFEDCILRGQIGCFSERENKALTEVLDTAFEDLEEVYAMSAVQKMMTKNMTTNQRKLARCAMGQGSDHSSGMKNTSFVYVLIAFFVCSLSVV